MRNLAIFLVEVRRSKNLFSIQQAAADIGVTEMCVRSFENGRTVNSKVLYYYLCRCMQIGGTVEPELNDKLVRFYDGSLALTSNENFKTNYNPHSYNPYQEWKER